MKKDLYGACPFVTTQKILQGKWAILILHYLSDGPVRFNALQKMVPNMTHATLSKQLKQLEAELETKLFTRTAHGIVLTDAGMMLEKYACPML